ncbi:MAG: hypothetical protein AB1486_11595 [Planctomycetota bacterium]
MVRGDAAERCGRPEQGPLSGRCRTAGCLVRAPLLVLFALFLFTPLLQAQSWNRAIFRNDEIEPRDFRFNEEYFLNIFSYQPPPEWDEAFEASDKAYLLTAGSLRSDEFYIREQLRIHLPMVEELHFHYDLLQDEDFDTRYWRQRVALLSPVHEQWSVYATGEGTALKEDNDVGIGAIYRRDTHDWWELQLTSVDFNEAKGKEGRNFPQSAYGLLLANEVPLGEMLHAGADLQFQLPMTLEDFEGDLTFRYVKRLYGAHVEWQPGEESSWRLFVTAEDTGKSSTWISTPEEDQDLARNAYRTGIEHQWTLSASQPVRCRTGLQYFHFRERSLFPGAPSADEKHERDEYLLFGGVSVEAWEKIYLVPAVYLEYVSQNELFPTEPDRNERFNGFQGKLSGAIEWRPRETLRLVINPNIDLDQLQWGGGNVQFIVTF